MSKTLAELKLRLREARTVTVLTGAGVSAASGVPTFRGEDGLWRKVRAETLATREAFAKDPKLVWEWYDWRRGMIAGVAPNDAHHILARWTREQPGVTVITQNVDGLHERAGTERLVRLHGSLWRVKCWSPCDDGADDWEDLTVPFATLPPRCPHCGGFVRPAVVWFGESLDRRDLAAADAATACDVFLTIGTSAVVHPAAGLVHTARHRGAFTVEINPNETPASDRVDLTLRMPADEALRTIDGGP